MSDVMNHKFEPIGKQLWLSDINKIINWIQYVMSYDGKEEGKVQKCNVANQGTFHCFDITLKCLH